MIKNDKIYEKVSEIIDSASTDFIEIVTKEKEADAPLKFNQRELVRRINFYINDSFLERDNDAIFWNISTPRIPHFAKLLQFDTKDFMPMGRGEYNFVQAWALRIKLREFFEDEQFYQILNDLSQEISIYGGAIWKLVKENNKTKVQKSKLENLYFDQSAEDIKKENIVEKHFLSKNSLWDKKDVWNNVEKLIEKDENKTEVWEYTGYIIEKGKPIYKHIIGYGYGEEDYLELWSEEITPEDNPYEYFRLGRYNGRFLGVGVVERLFKLQERTNELINQNAETTKIASLLLFKSNNIDMTGNVLESAENGQIVSDETFQQVGITNTGLSMFLQEFTLLSQQADKLCMTPEIVQGVNSPDNTTFRGIAVVHSSAVNAFTIFRQNIGEKIAHILMEKILPDVVKDWNKDSVIEIAQDDADIETYDNAVKDWMTRERLLNGEVITDQILNDIENQIANNINKTGRKVEIGKKFFDFEFGLKLMPTSETGDKAVMNSTYQSALQMTGANPALYNLPLFRQYLEDNGISYWKLTPQQQQQLQANPQAMPKPQQPDKLLTQAKIQG